jgi:hypothetical protein
MEPIVDAASAVILSRGDRIERIFFALGRLGDGRVDDDWFCH